MKITEDIRAAHQTLSNTSVNFIEFVERNPGVLDRSNFDGVYETKFDLVFPQPWPAFICPPVKKQLEESSRAVFKLIKCIPERLFANDIEKISQYFQIPANIVESQMIGVTHTHLNNILGRGDFIFSPLGLKCLEYNVTANVGGWSIAFMEPVYLNVPIISKFLQEYQVRISNKSLMTVLFEQLLEAAVSKNPNSEEINMAVVIPQFGKQTDKTLQKIHLDRIYKKILLLHHYENLKGEIIFSDFHHLQIVDNCLFYEDKRIHTLVEMSHGNVPSEIMEVFKAGNVLLYDGPIGSLLSNKLNLALLSENEGSDVFTPGEREIIEKYIPWTRKIVLGHTTFAGKQIELEDFLISNREKLVIKPADGLGGESVYVGRYTPDALWKEMIKIAARNKNWLVQEYIESLPFLYQSGTSGCSGHDVIWGIFIFGGVYAGTFLRVLPREKNIKGIINSHAGAEYSVVFEVEE